MTDSALHNAAARRSGPLLAHPGHAAMSELSPLPGVNRKSDFGAVRSAFDPTRTSASVMLQ